MVTLFSSITFVIYNVIDFKNDYNNFELQTDKINSILKNSVEKLNFNIPEINEKQSNYFNFFAICMSFVLVYSAFYVCDVLNTYILTLNKIYIESHDDIKNFMEATTLDITNFNKIFNENSTQLSTVIKQNVLEQNSIIEKIENSYSNTLNQIQENTRLISNICNNNLVKIELPQLQKPLNDLNSTIKEIETNIDNLNKNLTKFKESNELVSVSLANNSEAIKTEIKENTHRVLKIQEVLKKIEN